MNDLAHTTHELPLLLLAPLPQLVCPSPSVACMYVCVLHHSKKSGP